MNQQALELVKICLKTKNPNLDIGDCELTDEDFLHTDALVNLLRQCKHLKALYIYSNRISRIKGLENLLNLTTLDLSNNLLEDLSGLRGLNNLTALNLSYNKIKDLQGIEEFSRLKKLNVSNNQINNVKPLLPFLQPKKNLQIVFKNTDALEEFELNVKDNPFTTPPIEIVENGNESILHYFDEIEKQGTEYLYEAKMLIVGQPRAGKTTLRYKLFDTNSKLPTEDKTTRGIDIDQLQFEVRDEKGNLRPFKYNIWDFGGQQIYQTTHQFFLTHRSLYVLVIDTGNDSLGNDDTTINYWLQVVELLGNNSPLLLIRNEKNGRQINIDIPTKRGRFTFLKKDYSVDFNALIPNTKAYNKNRLKDFKILKDDIEHELKHLPLVGFPLPKTWLEIRNELKELSKTHPYIPKEKYLQVCATFDVVDFDKQMELSQLFHDLGVFLHFQHLTALDDFIVLQNVWATDAVFAVLDNTMIIENKGRFSERDLQMIWEPKGYKKEIHQKILSLMMQFELCYEIEGGIHNIYIVPEMLPDEPPSGYIWEENNDLPLHYRYDFMPHGILTRLIVRLNPHIHIVSGRQSVWKTGVKIDGNSLDCPGTVAEILEAWDNKQLLIKIQGKFAKELLTKLSYEVDSLNNQYFKQLDNVNNKFKSRWYKMIPCNCRSCTNHPDKHFFDYTELLDRKEFGKNTIGCIKKPYLTVSIRGLLEGVFPKKQSQTKSVVSKAKSIFISYSHKDEYWKNKLENHLSPLKNQELIKTWNDKQIESGLWDLQIQQAIEKADIYLLLITPNFLASSYIANKEIITAYKRFKQGQAKIFPIICDACAWQLQPLTKKEKAFHPVENKEMYVWLGKLQPFPEYGKPIKNWTNSNDGFLDVINQLKKHLI